MKKITVVVILSLIVALTACAPKPVETITPSGGEKASSSPAEVSEKPADDERLTLLSQQTKDYLDGKDFTGKTIVVGVWGGDYEEFLRAYVLPAFEAKGGKVEFLLGGAGDRVAKLYAERSNPTMDVAYINYMNAPQAVADGVVEAASDEIPAYADLIEVAKNFGGYGCAINATGLLYKKDVFPNPPVWKDLWDGKHYEKIGTPFWNNTIADAFVVNAALAAGKDMKDMEAAISKITELGLSPIVYTSNFSELTQYMTQGLLDAAPFQSSYAKVITDEFPDDLAFTFTDTPVMAMDEITLVSGSKNRDAALAWIQIMLDSNIQQKFAEKYNNGPTNSKTVLSGDVSERLLDKPEELKNLIALDPQWASQNRKDLNDKYTSEVLGGRKPEK